MAALHFLGPVRKKALYNTWYARLAPAARTLDVSLREVDPPKPKEGWYDWESLTIHLVRGYGDTALSFCHEYGHHVHTREFRAAQVVAWAEFWETHLLEMPTRYARTNAAEGFAESFSFYLVKPKQLKASVAAWLKAQGL